MNEKKVNWHQFVLIENQTLKKSKRGKEVHEQSRSVGSESF
jgi:hypothetical protein